MVTPTQPDKFIGDDGTFEWIFDPNPKAEPQTTESENVKEIIIVKVEETTKGNVNSTNKTITLWNKFINLLISFYHFIMENKVFSPQATAIEKKSETKDQPQVATIAIVHAPKPTATAAPTREPIDQHVAAALDDFDLFKRLGKDTMYELGGINKHELTKAWAAYDSNASMQQSRNWSNSRSTRPLSLAARERLGLDKEALAKATIEIEL